MAADRQKSDLLQGTLDVLILKIVALGRPMGTPSPSASSRCQAPCSRFSRAASDTGREARFYSLTKLGRKQLAAQRANWDRLSAAVSGILSTAE